jgi:DNA-binding NarL/FixJ family response regulator
MSVPAQSLRTILVEDNADIRDGLIAALAEIAHAEVIAVADTAEDGIATLERHAAEWQLAILDLFLKRGHGLEILRASVKRRPDQRIFIVTNYATPDIRRRAVEAGADAVFDKSTELEKLFDACRALALDR